MIKNTLGKMDTSPYSNRKVSLDSGTLSILSTKLIECLFLDDIITSKKLINKGADIFFHPIITDISEKGRDDGVDIEPKPAMQSSSFRSG